MDTNKMNRKQRREARKLARLAIATGEATVNSNVATFTAPLVENREEIKAQNADAAAVRKVVRTHLEARALTAEALELDWNDAERAARIQEEIGTAIAKRDAAGAALVKRGVKNGQLTETEATAIGEALANVNAGGNIDGAKDAIMLIAHGTAKLTAQATDRLSAIRVSAEAKNRKNRKASK